MVCSSLSGRQQAEVFRTSVRLAPVQTSSAGNPDQRLSLKGYLQMFILLDKSEPQVYVRASAISRCFRWPSLMWHPPLCCSAEGALSMHYGHIGLLSTLTLKSRLPINCRFLARPQLLTHI